jgi:hypothetical protein
VSSARRSVSLASQPYCRVSLSTSVAPSAGFADTGEDRDADFGQDQRAIAGHGGEQSTGERRGNATSCSHHYADLWSGRRDPERLRKNYRRPRCMTPRPRAPQEGVNDDNSWDRRDWQCRFSRVWTQAQPGPRRVFWILFICTLEQHRRAPLCSCRRLKRR